jgi:hypothetical protein
MGENFGNHRGIFNGGNDFQGTTTVWAMLNVDIEYPFEQSGPAHVGSSRVMGGIKPACDSGSLFADTVPLSLRVTQW